MSFATKITQFPDKFQPDIAAEAEARFAGSSEAFLRLISGTAGCSPYLAGLLAKEHEWIIGLETRDAEEMCAQVLTDVRATSASDMSAGLRQAKRRIALLAGLADLGGVWTLEQVTQALTDLADTCVDHALKTLVGAEISRGKLPGMTEKDAEDAAGMAVLAMGKMGAAELNYSSDIDLICLFDETRYTPDTYMEARTAFVRVTRRLAALLSDVTAEGYVFRTDLRLRPDASVTPVCIAMETAERYYESVGRTWERAAFIKARVCAGDIAAGQAFLARLTPFVWRKHLDFAAIQDAHDMRLRIRDHKKLGGAFTLEGHNMKLGSGGIREIEFFTQTRQIIAGGRDAKLRVRGTVEGLALLAKAGWVSEEVTATLTDNYRYFRQVEHRLQMIQDAQTHMLPTTKDGFARLAAFMGVTVEALRSELTRRLTETAHLTEAFFAPDTPQAPAADTAQYLEKWRSFPALRSPRAAEIFQRVFPAIHAKLNVAARPEEAMQAFERFVSGLPAGVQVFSLFEANPQLSELIVEICTASSDMAAYLSRNAQVFDAVLGGDFFRDWPGQDGLRAALSSQLAQAADYEARLDMARRWQKEWHFRISVHQLRGLITPEDAGAQYAQLAGAVLQALTPVVEAQFAVKHGPPPGRGAVVLAMGSLGVGRLSARSDLDLIVIYDADGAEASDGPRPLATRPYFARFTQMLVTALTAPTAEGKLYEVDMRLRPSGQSGPVATSLQSFESYQAQEAWLWEHMALTRARALTGDEQIISRINAVRKAMLTRARVAAETAKETQEMRARLADAGRTGSAWGVKDGPGGVQDIEIFAQAMALQAGAVVRDTAGQLQAAEAAGLIDADQRDSLTENHALFFRLTSAGRLLSDQPFEPAQLGAEGQAMVLRDLNASSLPELEKTLLNGRKTARAIIDQVLNAMQA